MRRVSETIAGDLLDSRFLDRLPEVANVIFMAGMKFGATSQQSRTWAMNSFLPGLISQKFRNSRIVAFSTGNVYPLTPVDGGGCRETDDPAPIGEYAMSCLGRERIFEHFSRSLNIQMSLVRLSYAVEMRYGVLIDMAQRVWANEPIDLAMGSLNAIWQGDANAVAIECFNHVSSPPLVINVTGPTPLSIRKTCLALGKAMGRTPRFGGTESGSAYISNTELCQRLFGAPSIEPPQMIAWTADWVSRGGQILGRPTHFETRDGKY